MFRLPALLEQSIEKAAHQLAGTNRVGLKQFLVDIGKELKAQHESGTTSAVHAHVNKFTPHSQRTAMAHAVFRAPGVYGALSKVLEQALPLVGPSRESGNALLRGGAGGRRGKHVLMYGSSGGIAPWTLGELAVEHLMGMRAEVGQDTGVSSLMMQWINSITLIEPEAAFADLGNRLFDHGSAAEPLPWHPLVKWRKFLPSEGPSGGAEAADLVLSCYSLNKIGAASRRKDVIRSLWAHTSPGGYLALVESGSPEGFSFLQEARAELVRQQTLAEIVAPCKHRLACPMDTKISWCHFPVRIQRTRLMMLHLGKSPVNYFDEKYCYLIARRSDGSEPLPPVPIIPDSRSISSRVLLKEDHDEHGEDDAKVKDNEEEDATTLPPMPSRVIAPPRKRGGHVILDVCAQDGNLHHSTVSRTTARQSDGYKAFRKARWGDSLNVPASALDAGAQVTDTNRAVAINVARRKDNLKRISARHKRKPSSS